METNQAYITPPSKEQIRAWLGIRRLKALPLPSIEQIQHELGWVRSMEASGKAT
jgi:hypothetical protein